MSVMTTTPGAWYQDRLLTVHDPVTIVPSRLTALPG